MNRDHPTGTALLAFAAEVLRHEILPSIPDDKKLQTLMVLRAMAIAEREFRASEGTGPDVLSLYPPDGGDRTDDSAEAAMARLADDIRNGRFDAPDRARALYEVLLADVTARLRIANPGYLDTQGQADNVNHKVD